MGLSYDKSADEWMMVSEFLSNGSLYDHLYKEKFKKVPSKFIPGIIKEIISAMAHTHKKEIVHRDLKSSNILLDEEWHVKVADFGLSKRIIKEERNDNESPVGTPNWMAPELYRYRSKNTKETDIWSFGLIVWEILFERVPFKDYNMEQLDYHLGLAPIHDSTNFVSKKLWSKEPIYNDQFLVRMS